MGGVIPYARGPGVYEGGEIRTGDMAQHLRVHTSFHSNGMDKELFVLEIRPTQTEK